MHTIILNLIYMRKMLNCQSYRRLINGYNNGYIISCCIPIKLQYFTFLKV